MPAPPRGQLERQLEQTQKLVTQGEIARRRRDDIAFALWQEGHTQKDIAERMDRADRAAGGDGITHGQVQKTLFRIRRELEQELVATANGRHR